VWLVGVGLTIGLAGAALGVRVLRSLLANVSPFDPLTLVSVSVLVIAVGLLACYWPARRASRVNPMVLLRQS